MTLNLPVTICAVCEGMHNKHNLFLHTALIDVIFVIDRDCVFHEHFALCRFI